MAKAMAAALEVTFPKGSILFGKAMFQEVKETENPNTKEKTKKVVILSKELHDLFEITVPYETDLSAISEDAIIEFDNLKTTFRANARNGYGNSAIGWLTITGTAEAVYEVGKPKPVTKEKA